MNPPILREKVEIAQDQEHLAVKGVVVRHVGEEWEGDNGWRLQIEVANITKKILDDVECRIKYYDKNENFLGMDYDVALEEIAPGATQPFTIDLNYIPSTVTKGIIELRSTKKVFFRPTPLFIATTSVIIIIGIHLIMKHL
jgi:hypothetical protein